jgi:hypothetical protein
MQEEKNGSFMAGSLWGEEEKIGRLKIVMQVILAIQGKSLRCRERLLRNHGTSGGLRNESRPMCRNDA